jgi:transposase
LRVRVIRRPRYGCRACEEAVVQAPAPERPIDGGMATEALLAHVLVNKYADHLPLYRQAQIFARQACTGEGRGRDAGPLDVVQLGGPRLLVAGSAA